MVRAMGAVFVILSCTGFGMAKATEDKKRIQALYRFKGLLLMLRGEIQYAKTPFAEAFENLAGKEEGKYQKFLTEVSAQLLKMDGHTFTEIWKEKVDIYLSQCGFYKEDLNQIKQFGERLGYLDYAMQISTIDWQVEQMEMKLRELEPQTMQKQKLYRCVGLFSGLLISVLLM